MSGKRREALSVQRHAAPVRTSGDPGLAARLARALTISPGAEDRHLTHGFHTYPARMHPHTARLALEAAGAGVGTALLDPFCGSGTVLVEGVRAGARARGVDASPLALLVAGAKVWAAPGPRRAALVAGAKAIAARTIEEGKAARRSGYEAPRERGGRARDEALRGWFDPHVRREMETLAALVAGVQDAEMRETMRAVLSSVLVKVSRRASDTVGEKTERKIGRGMAARWFVRRAEELAAGLEALWKSAPSKTPPVRLELGDARDLRSVADGEIGVIVTSPPYAGTYDYLEHHRLRLAFLGLPHEGFEAREIGARRRFRAQDVRRALDEWDRDFGRSLREMARVLKKGGKAVLLVGDSLAGARDKAVAVLADNLVARLTRDAGLEVAASASVRRPLLGAAEREAFRAAGEEKSEHLVVLVKG